MLFLDLPPEIILEIVSTIDDKDQRSLRTACSHLYHIVPCIRYKPYSFTNLGSVWIIAVTDTSHYFPLIAHLIQRSGIDLKEKKDKKEGCPLNIQVCARSEVSYHKYCNLVGSSDVSLGYSKERHTEYIKKQFIKRKYKPGDHWVYGPKVYRGLTIIDDCPEYFKTDICRDIHNYTDHLNHVAIYVMKQVVPLPPPIRRIIQNTIFFKPKKEDLNQLYADLGGSSGKKSKFEHIIHKYTSDDRFLTITIQYPYPHPTPLYINDVKKLK